MNGVRELSWDLQVAIELQNKISKHVILQVAIKLQVQLIFQWFYPTFCKLWFHISELIFLVSSGSNKGKTHVANVNVKAIVDGTSLMTNFKISKIDLVDLIVNEKEKEKAFVNTKKKQKVKLEYMCYKISLG